MKKRIGFYPGSFDPITNGHLDVIGHAVALVDGLVIGIGVSATKQPLLRVEQRRTLLLEAVRPLTAGSDCEIEVVEFDDLVVDAARRANATILVRGLRDTTDFDYEMQMVGMNSALAPEIRTVFFPASPAVRHISATLVRQISNMGGDIAAFVPPNVRKILEK